MLRHHKTDVILVTGLSGSGRATVLKWFEDTGYEAVDNLPLSLVVALLRGRLADAETDLSPRPQRQKVVICLDVRSRGFTPERLLALKTSLASDLQLNSFLLYLECDDDQLLRRFTETRRRHPLAEDRPIRDGIRAERSLFGIVRAEADLVLDTTGWSPHDLRHRLEAEFAPANPRGISLTLMSFSYKNGLPREADLVFDVRFLDNPHWHNDLRRLDGRDAKIAEFIESDPDFADYFSHLHQLLMPLWPRFHAEGKSYVTVAFGCTGGRHRSVYVAEKWAAHLRQLQSLTHPMAMDISLVHRDLNETTR